MLRHFFLLSTVCLLLAAGLPDARADQGSLQLVPPAGVRTVSFLARDLADGTDYKLNAEALDQRHPPFSTFKIPNFLIVLQHGAVDDAATAIAWDPERRPAQSWWPASWQSSQDLSTAFRRSAVWTFQDLAQRVGGDAYRSILSQWQYGNARLSGNSDRFWLDGELRISPREQVAFMQRLMEGQLAVAQEHVQALWQASRVLEGEAGVLHAKTGAGPLDGGRMDGPFAGWYVGAIRREDRPGVVFALYAEADRYRDLARYRADASQQLLEQAGLWQ